MSKISKSRLLATSAVAGLSILQFAPLAQAQDSFGIHNDQPEPLEITVAEDDEVVGEDIGIYADNGAVIVDNLGDIRGNGTFTGSVDSRPSGGIVIAQPGSSVTNSGTISGGAHGIATSQFFSEDENGENLPPQALVADTVVVNSGTIVGEGGSGVGLVGGGSLTNSGTIQGHNNVNGGANANGIGVAITEFPGAIDPDATGIGSIVNDEDGTIEGQTFGIVLSGGGTIENDGLIRSTGAFNPATGVTPIGIVLGATPEQEGRVATLDNDGVVLGFIGVLAGGPVDATIDNGGIINGQFAGIMGQSTGNLVVNNADGAEIASGGTAIIANTSTLTVNNAGTIRGANQNAINILTADAVIENSGTIEGAQSGIVTNLAQVSPGVTEPIAANTTIVNSGTIVGNGGAGVSLAGGGSVTNNGLIQGFTSANGSAPGIGVAISEFAGAVDPDATGVGSIVNDEDGVIEGQRFGIVLQGGGTIDNNGGHIRSTGQFDPNNPGAVPFGIVMGASEEQQGRSATLNNDHGVIQGFFGVLAGGSLETTTINNAGIIVGQAGAILGQSTGDLIVTNAEGAEIIAGGNGIAANTSTLTVENAGTIRGQSQNGINILTADAVINNSGTIEGGQFGITTNPFQVAPGVFEGRAVNTSVTNSGTIIGNNDDGVRLIGGGSVTNSGTIEGRGTPFADGISMYPHTDQANEDYSASVTNEEGGSIAGQRFGIILSAGGDVANAGEITGFNGGVYIQGTATNTDAGEDRSGLTASVVNSGTIRGTGNLGGSGGDGFGVGFGSDMSSASLDNSGTIVSDFGAGVSQGSRADVAITNAEGGTITGATSGIYSFATGSLVVNNAGTIRGEGSYDGFDAAPDAGITITTAASAVTNSGTISGAGAGITTAYQYDEESQTLVGLAIGTEIENSGTIAGESNDGVRLIGGGTVANSGTISGTGSQLADGISIYAYEGQDSASFAASVVNAEGGAITGDRFGVIVSGGGDVVNAGSISGNAAGVLIQSDLANTPGQVGNFTNSGTIASADGVAIIAHVQANVVNAGTLAGGSGAAIALDRFDDTVTLHTGSVVNGAMLAGEGHDSLILDGDVLELTEAQQVGAAIDFEELTVAAGYWSTTGYVGEFNAVTIAEGGALQVNEIEYDEGLFSTPIFTPTIANNGLLVANFDHDDVVSGLGQLSVSGTGAVKLIGEGVFTLDTASFAHTGGTTVANGGLILTGTLLGDVTTEGDGFFQLGTGGTEGDFSGDIVNNGRFVFNRSDDYDFLGAFSGNGTLDKMGDSILTFMGDYSFEGVTNILGGSVRIGGTIDPTTDFNLGAGGSLDISGKDQTIGGLAGEQGSNVQMGENNLTVAQDANSQFGGTISGSGSFTKEGDGTLNLTGDSDYTGPTAVNGGKLAVNGSIVSDVTVNNGGTLGGNGTVGSTTVAAGGTIAPGNSIGRLTVNGDLAFAAGSVYEVEVNAAGQGDRLDATGAVTIASTASVAVLAEEGDYNPRTDYVILTGAGGVTGTFGSVTTDLAFLDPLLRYGANSVTLSLYRNDIDFADVAIGFNQASVATAIQSLGIDNPLFEAVLVQNAATAQASFGDLSGEIHANAVSGLTDDSRHLRNALFGMRAPVESGAFVWGSAFGGWGKFDAQPGGLGMSTDHKGLVAGIGYGGNGFAAALSAGIGGSDFKAKGRGDSADVESKYLAAHATYGAPEGGFRGTIGIAYAWHDLDNSRAVTVAPLAQTLTSKYDASTLQIFGEVGYDMTMGKAAITPFARLAHVKTDSEGFTEAGGNAALVVADVDQKTTFLSLGARARFNAGEAGFQPYVSAAWNRAFDDRGAIMISRFAAGGTPFGIIGTPIPKNSAEVEAGFDYSAGAFNIGAAYTGTLASDRNSHGVRVTARIAF
ncbi:autotransporter domain-containing protein [Sphingopyxis macrogoltabida]|uniref:Autotransporter domain-containing protein n=1 Tax=Sphingopyxis macrogoltabida TaxID=33050 RepID=A0AAC9AY25_SPHMC|nr:autotransporter domain-containing protein [Sphingopyxis macrogoltabida]ALJ15874.1 hypothetical protein LH19_23605 [Sphingopyxis macrogoltabida]AMU92114.1 hypothetical protein ATM17_24165 [Sphingopyxis macrogoltabida]